MPSNSKLFVKPFIGGLNTELSSVEDAILHTSDELNCTILPEGMRGRRLGFNIERDGKWIEGEPSQSYSGYYWKNVNKTGQNIIVKQQGSILYFYDADTKPFSLEENLLGTCNISDCAYSAVNGDIGPLRYAIGDGKLFIVNKNIHPARIMYTGEKFIASVFSLFVRDHEGVEDGYAVDYMPDAPTSSNDYEGLTQEHHYNLLNQGWNESDLETFKTDKNKWPSNNLQWFLGKDDSGKYNTEKLLQTYFGNTPAPRGHFVLDLFEKDRSGVSGVSGLYANVAMFSVGDPYVHSRSLKGEPVKKHNVDVLFKKEAKAVKQVRIKYTMLRRKSAKKAYDDKWSGKIKYSVYGGNINLNDYDAYWLDRLDSWNEIGDYNVKDMGRYFKIVPDNIEWKQLATDVEHVYGATPTTPHVIKILLTDNETAYNVYKVVAEYSDGNGTSDIPEPIKVQGSVNFMVDSNEEVDDDLLPSFSDPKTITDITYMPGRLFYLVNDTVLFSQVIKESGYGFDRCYQDADPTSEEISDVLPTDGGYVKLNNIGVGKALETFNRGVLVFGENIVYGLISPLEKNFTATEYDVVELSRAGLIGSRSVVSTDNMVYYWSPLGIFRIGINPQTGTSMVAECITHTTIQEWYDRIPNESKETCRGCFDYVNNRIYWYYSQPDDEEAEEPLHKLNRCLVYDLTYGAFMPFKVEGDEFITDVFNTKTSYEISPTLYIKAGGERVVSNGVPVIGAEEDTDFKRWTAVQHIIADTKGSTSFGDYNSREFKDFDEHQYDSYMVSRPIMFEGISAYGNPINSTFGDKQVPILQTLFKRTEQVKLANGKDYLAASGANIRMRWGWALDDRSNRWDMVQNGYRPQKDFLHDEYVESRIHVRGRGKAFQVEIRNDSNKDFRLAGMNLLVRSK